MDKDTKNEPAFPSKREGVNNEPEMVYQTGMTLRDYFAGQALAGLVARYGDPSSICYRMADLMLAEREKGTRNG